MKTYLADQALIIAIRERSRIGAEALYDQYAGILFKIICCRTCNRVSAETVLEETFLTIWTTINDYQPENGRLLLWMSGIARTLAVKSCNPTILIPSEPVVDVLLDIRPSLFGPA